MSGREEWLHARHARWQTPLVVLQRLVRDATGESVAEHERLIRGEANETYRVRTGGGRTLLVKISHFGIRSFAPIREASVAFLAAGINVPRVLWEGRIETGDDSLPAVVQTYLEGEPVRDAIPHAQPETIARWIHEAGVLLARMHLVPFESAPVSKGPTPGQQTLADAIANLPFVAHALTEKGLDPNQIEAVLARNGDALDDLRRCRVHGDFGPGHLIIANNQIAGVIDLDQTEIATPLTDIVRWDTYSDQEPHPTTALLEGYRSVNDLGDIEHARQVLLLARSVGYLRYYLEVAHPRGAQHILGLTERTLSDLRSL